MNAGGPTGKAEDDRDAPPKHMNGCSCCKAPDRKKSRILWFSAQAGYLELCEDHWAEVRAYVLGESVKPMPAGTTLEAFA
jgi:hypothetical protein